MNADKVIKEWNGALSLPVTKPRAPYMDRKCGACLHWDSPGAVAFGGGTVVGRCRLAPFAFLVEGRICTGYPEMPDYGEACSHFEEYTE